MKTTHVWDGSNIALELNASNAVSARYIRGVNLIKTDKNVYFLYNAHGDVVQLTNASGGVTKQYFYDAFGVEIGKADNDTNPWRYCGEYWDEETGTVYLRARRYDPRTGRFLSEDPIRDGLNYYTYCSNNPIAFIDPWGLADIAVRSTIEGLGCTVTWNDKTKKATVSLDGQKVKVYVGDGNGTYIDKNGRMHTDDGWLFKALAGMTFELGKGWTGRIERHGSSDGYQRHVVLTDRYGNEHAQNEDGSPHDKGGSPPSSVKKSLINKKGWDWDAKEKDWLNKIEVTQGVDGDGWIINYPNGREVMVLTPRVMGVSMHVPYPNNNDLKNYYTGPTIINPRSSSPSNGGVPILPMPNPVPLPVPGPIFIPLTI